MKTATPIFNEQIASLPFYVTRAAYDFIENKSFRENGFEEYQIMQCTSGKGIFICEDSVYEINEYDIVIFEPYVPHQYFKKSGEEPWMLNWVCFLANNNEMIIKQLIKGKHCVIKNINAPRIEEGLKKIVYVLEEDFIYNQIQASTILYGVILEIMAYKWEIVYQNLDDQILKPVITYMQQNLKQDISVEELSDIIGVSKSYLCRKFNQIYKVSPIKYLISLRMIKARDMIIDLPHMKIKQIANECGYKDIAYFCAEFKRYFRLTPVQYKRSFLR